MRKGRQQDIAVLAAATILLGAIGISRVVTHTSTSASPAPTVPTKVLGEQFTRETTTTTMATVPAVAPTTSTTAAPKKTTTTQGPPPTVLVTVTSVPDCGSGEAGARSEFHAVSTSDPDTFTLTGQVDVVNNLSKAIEVDKLAVRVTYADGSYDVVKFPSAVGAQVQPGEDKPLALTFDAGQLPTATSVESLDYHVVGVPGCSAQLQPAA